ncbi:MAG: hypothetical protein ACYDC3_06270 [Candidatus Binataceae bacterium]
MEQRRFSSFASSAIGATAHGRIVEHELDMERERRQPPLFVARISAIVRWLLPESHRVGPPMRSVARELEERFPTRDN